MSLLRYFKASSDTTKLPDSRSPLSIYECLPSLSIESTINITWYALAGDEATINAEVKRVIETEESSGRRKRGHYGFQIGKHAAENGVAATILC